MPQGLQVWDDQGRLLVDLGDWLGRLAGSVSVGVSTAGSVTNALLTTGTPFFIWIPSSAEPPKGEQNVPIVTFSGATMSWSGIADSGSIIYGVR